LRYFHVKWIDQPRKVRIAALLLQMIANWSLSGLFFLDSKDVVTIKDGDLVKERIVAVGISKKKCVLQATKPVALN